jgi:hypothetical protein
MKTRALPLNLSLSLILCSSFAFAQSKGNTAVCKLGSTLPDSTLNTLKHIEIDCSNSEDLKLFGEKSKLLAQLEKIELSGAADSVAWQSLFSTIATHPTVKSLTFYNNQLSELPAGYELCAALEQISIEENDDLDYSRLLLQLQQMRDLKELQLELYTINDLPASFEKDLTNISFLTLINKDEFISENDMEISIVPEPVMFDYSTERAIGGNLKIRYIALAGKIDNDEAKTLSERFDGKRNYSTTNQAFALSPKYNFVKPPIEGLDVEKQLYTINPQIENILLYPSGTKILIPANSFVDKNGSIVTGTVTVSYREFRDAADFLVSGIPMKYDSAGSVGNFESAGMFEITANDRNDMLDLAPGKEVKLNFASTSVDSTYNFYSFNDETGNWEFKNRPSTVTSATEIKFKMLSNAYSYYRALMNGGIPYRDSTSFAKRFEDMSYRYTTHKSHGERHHYYSKGKNLSKPLSTLVKITRVKRTKNNDILFKLRFLNSAHPELNEFNNCYFALDEEIPVTEFKKKFMFKKGYNDVRVLADGSTLELKLKDENKISSLKAHLVIINNENKVEDAKDQRARQKRYQRRLARREKEFAKMLRAKRQNERPLYLTDPVKKSQIAFERCKPMMSQEEQRMTIKEWLSYYDQVIANEQQLLKEQNLMANLELDKAEASASNLVQSLSINGMGIYNCDQIQRLQQPVEIFASYRTNDNKKLKAKATYIIDKTTNAVMQYDGYMGYGPSKIAFSNSKSAQNILIAVRDNRICLFSTEDFKKERFSNKEEFEFIVTPVDKEFTTVADLKKIIGL